MLGYFMKVAALVELGPGRMPKFEEFSRDDARARHEGVMFTLQARGLISFNHAAFMALGEPDSVALLYDTAENIVAMRSVPKSHENAYTVLTHTWWARRASSLTTRSRHSARCGSRVMTTATAYGDSRCARAR